MDWGMTGIGRREGEDVLSLCTLLVKEILRNWLKVPFEAEGSAAEGSVCGDNDFT